MARRRQAFHSNPELQRFVLPEVRPTGRQLGVGSYGSVEEIETNGLICAGKRLHEALLERDNEGVINIERKFFEECQVMSLAGKCDLQVTTALPNISWYNLVGNGRDAPPPHCAVPGIVFPARVDTSYAGDGATGQQPR